MLCKTKQAIRVGADTFQGAFWQSTGGSILATTDHTDLAPKRICMQSGAPALAVLSRGPTVAWRLRPCGRLAALAVRSAAIAVVLLTPTLGGTQDVTEPALKAAYIYNFVLFTAWPADAVAPASSLVVCVASDPAVGDALAQAVKDRPLAGRRITVTPIAAGGSVRACHVLYVSGGSTARAREMVSGLRGVPVLTISDVEGFTEFGGIALFFFDQGRLRFSVDNDAAKRAGLVISSRLLTLARPR